MSVWFDHANYEKLWVMPTRNCIFPKQRIGVRCSHGTRCTLCDAVSDWDLFIYSGSESAVPMELAVPCVMPFPIGIFLYTADRNPLFPWNPLHPGDADSNQHRLLSGISDSYTADRNLPHPWNPLHQMPHPDNYEKTSVYETKFAHFSGMAIFVKKLIHP